MRSSEHKIALLCLKYIPVVMFLSMWIYTLFALFGVNLWLADTIMGCSILPSLLIFSLSQIFHFCILHKSLTAYSLCVDLLINIEKYFGFGSALVPIQTIVALVGFILFICLLYKIDAFKNKCVYLDFLVVKNKKDKIYI